MTPNTSTVVEVDLPKPNVTSSEDEQILRKSSSLKMDEDFDIEKFTGVSSQEVNKEVSLNLLEREDDSGVTADMSDDEFLLQFPEIDINQVNKKKPAPSRRGIVKQPRTIAEYAIATPDPPANELVTSSPLIGTLSATPCTSRGIHQNENVSLKRRLNDVLVYDEDAENRSPKRFRPTQDCLEMNDFIADKNALNQNILASTSKSNRNPLAIRSVDHASNKQYLTDDSSEDEIRDEIKDDDKNNCNDMDYNMPFPNSGEDINFDVTSISKKPDSQFRVNSLGDKRMQDYLRERSLTTESIQQLYDSITKSPKDGIERDPRGLATQLMPHQRQALKWMKWREQQKPAGGILADDMGLGKTVQMISLVLAAKNERKERELANGVINDDSDYDFYDLDMDLENCNSREIHDGRTLVVCPASLTKQWEREVNTKCRRGQLRAYVYHGTSRQINEKRLSKFDIVITTYNLLAQEYELHVLPKKNKDSRIFRINWERVILDEAHYIRNHKSKASIAVCQLTSKNRWALTGTPIQNKESDFYALLKFVKCSPFDEWNVWKRWVCNKNSAGNKRLVVITKSLMLRRTKDELMSLGVIEKLPDKKFDVIDVKLDLEEKLVYQKLLLYSQTFFAEFLRQRKDKEHLKEFGCHARPSLYRQEVPDKLSKLLKILMRHHAQIETHCILVLILRLRQMCCHPALIKSMLDKEDLDLDENDQEPTQINSEMMDELNRLMTDDEDDDDEFNVDEKMTRNIMSRTNPIFKNDRKSSKVRAVLETIDGILDKGEKVIVVSQWTGFLRVIASHLGLLRDAKWVMFEGKVPIKERQQIVDKLNDSDDRLNILLLSLCAGGVGLNLVGANNLLLVDLHWNPQLETQAQDRIYRFGQENNVHIYKFICKDTIEEKVKLLQDGKLLIAKNVLTGTVSNKLTIEDLKLLFS